MVLRLRDLMSFEERDKHHIRLRFHVWNGSVDYTRFYYLSDKDQVNDWNIFYNPSGKRYFSKDDIVLNFVKIGHNKWLFTTAKVITEDLGINGGKAYEGQVLERLSPHFDRLIVTFKPGISTVRYFDRCADEIVVSELLAEPFAGLEFPGYDNLSMSYQQLEAVLRLEQRDWLTALSHQKAVYLITDTYTGKLYVGSATSDSGMLLQRWKSYVANGHGGNKELRNVVRERGFDYVKEHFQYSLLENYNAKIDDNYVLKRESFWKNVLCSRIFGYNAN